MGADTLATPMADTPTTTLRKTALFDLHESQGGRMVPFAGWAMPVQYRGIVDEHNAVRERAGVFDVSHMGRLFVVGQDAGRLIRRAVTYDVTRLEEGQGHYTLLCNDDGGIIDDPYVYRLDDQRFLFVGNASNANRDTERVRSFIDRGMEVELLERQEQTVMLAVQGPERRRTWHASSGRSWRRSTARRAPSFRISRSSSSCRARDTQARTGSRS